jgi:glycosyl hydrolase family 43
MSTKRKTSGNPLIKTISTADPSAHVWNDGRIYVYASHDIDPPRGCDLMDKYHVFSSGDMVNWQDEGEILSSDDVPWGRKSGGFMWAPDCAYKNGTYYFYYPHPREEKWNDTWKIGVATSNKPAKGFIDHGFIEGTGGFAMIDPAVFVEGDKAYFYYGGGGLIGGCYCAELSDDMLSLKTKLKKIRRLWKFHEAAWVFKRGQYYYLIYSDMKRPHNCYRYCMSRSPLGKWKHKGVFLDSTGCDTTHGSVVEFKGEWYLFYHNQAISDQGNLRSVCVDKLHFNSNGTIKKVIQTKEGVPMVGEETITQHPLEDYIIQNSTVGNGTQKTQVGNSGTEMIIEGFNNPDSFCEFKNLDGRDGGRAELSIYYDTLEKWAKLRLIVNGEDHSYINFVASNMPESFKERAFITVRFQSGNSNVVRLIGGVGDVKINKFTVKLLDELD